MPEGWLSVLGLLALGYLMILAELFVPGGILGVIGVIVVIVGCNWAFDMGIGWGAGAVVVSVAITVLGLRAIFHSRAGHKLVLGSENADEWKSADESLTQLLGQQGTTLSSLRPAGIAEIAGRRIDAVTDSEFLDAGQSVRVCEVEGGRVVVEALSAESAAPDSEPAKVTVTKLYRQATSD